MIGFTVVTGVAGHLESADADAPPGVEHQRLKVRMVTPHARSRPHRQNHVTLGRDADGQLRQTANRPGTAGFTPFFTIFGFHPPSRLMAAAFVMSADMMRIERAG